jgi:hypothetical protein
MQRNFSTNNILVKYNMVLHGGEDSMKLNVITNED